MRGSAPPGHHRDLPFGGKAFVGLGDFRQVAPVIRGASGLTATFDNSIRSSDLWEHFEILRHASTSSTSAGKYASFSSFLSPTISPDYNGTSIGMLKVTYYTESYHSHDTI